MTTYGSLAPDKQEIFIFILDEGTKALTREQNGTKNIQSICLTLKAG
jgi:hypothetical protein